MDRAPTRPTGRFRVATAVRAVAPAALLALAVPLAPAIAAENPEAAAMPAAAERPARGLRMEQVESRWGAPTTRHDAVGRPPITRWDYPGFVVYFEDRHVVHAVLK